jgi:Calcineurin-like phosphoesterase
MIDRVLDRAFVLEQAESLRTELDKLAREEEEDAALRAVRRGMLAALLTYEGRDDELTPAARKAFIPSDPGLSLLQSTMEERMRATDAIVLEPAPDFNGAGGPIATDVVGQSSLDEAMGDFTKLDPLWLSEIPTALLERARRGSFPFACDREPPAAELAEDALVLLVSDWGTGAAAALAVGTAIRSELDAAGDREAHVVHLGDVYYAGTEWEARERLLKPWPIRPDEAGPRRRSWCVNANHDMYSGGWGYYDGILRDPRFSHQQTDGEPVSYFRLFNPHWQVLGLDTAWEDHLLTHQGHDGFLADPQTEWIMRSMDEDRRRRTVLLSHHQLFSRHGRVRGNLATKLADVMRDRTIDAWFWGHEHRCMTFAPRPRLRYAACVGHGAMPQPAGETNPEQGEWEYAEWREDVDGDRWRLCGFAVLDFAGPDLTVRYVNERGDTIRREPVP